MGVTLTSKALCGIGLISLLHAAYSAAQHRSYLRLTEQEFTHLPLDIIIQTLCSLIVVCYSATAIAGNFAVIRANAEAQAKTFETFGNCPSFYNFEHRAKSLSVYFNSANLDRE